ncbi:transposase [candidate division KSB1 bacterium]|nr:transposase [candidate division KSB1 bacterium]
MTFDPEVHKRKSIRLREYDYSQPGAYFITLCTHNRQCLFGEVVDGEMQLNELGEVVQNCWDEIPNHYTNTETDAFIVMPNHVHEILFINNNVGTRHAVSLRKFGNPIPNSLSTIVGGFKSAATRRINQQRNTPNTPVWQRNFYDHIIRDEDDLSNIRDYIVYNALKWESDKYFK